MSKKVIKSNNLLISYVVKSLISSIIISTAMLILFSKIILNLDLGDVYYNIFSVLILLITSLITSLISVGKMKNNILIMSLLSNSLLIIITVINAFTVRNIILTVFQLVTVIISSFIASIIISKRKSKFKV